MFSHVSVCPRGGAGIPGLRSLLGGLGIPGPMALGEGVCPGGMGMSKG